MEEKYTQSHPFLPLLLARNNDHAILSLVSRSCFTRHPPLDTKENAALLTKRGYSFADFKFIPLSSNVHGFGRQDLRETTRF